jgi:hypothetical protein
MSALSLGYASLAGAASFVQTAMFTTQRAIASIIPDCAIEERHLDRMMVTQHPVEQSASISDHTYKMPTEVTIRWGWSASPTLSGAINGLVSLVNGQGFITPQLDEIYSSLLALQVSGEVFGLSTGKRNYPSMVLTSLLITTDKETENVLMVTAVCTQVIIVATQSVSVPAASAQTNPQQSNAVTATGPQTPAQVPSQNSSVLNSWFGS